MNIVDKNNATSTSSKSKLLECFTRYQELIQWHNYEIHHNLNLPTNHTLTLEDINNKKIGMVVLRELIFKYSNGDKSIYSHNDTDLLKRFHSSYQYLTLHDFIKVEESTLRRKSIITKSIDSFVVGDLEHKVFESKLVYYLIKEDLKGFLKPWYHSDIIESNESHLLDLVAVNQNIFNSFINNFSLIIERTLGGYFRSKYTSGEFGVPIPKMPDLEYRDKKYYGDANYKARRGYIFEGNISDC